MYIIGCMVKGKLFCHLLKWLKQVRKTLFRTIAIGVKTITVAGRDEAQHWVQQRQPGFIANKQNEGSVDGKLPRGDIKGRDDSY